MKTLRTLTSFVLTGFLLSSCYSGKNWRTASRQSAGMAPDPSVTMEAVMQVYGADHEYMEYVPMEYEGNASIWSRSGVYGVWPHGA